MDFWEQICCSLSDKMSVEVFSPIWSHVNENEKKKKKNEILPIFIQHWYGACLEVCMDFWESICYVLSEEMSFEVFSPIWSHANANEKKIVKKKKIKKCKILALFPIAVFLQDFHSDLRKTIFEILRDHLSMDNFAEQDVDSYNFGYVENVFLHKLESFGILKMLSSWNFAEINQIVPCTGVQIVN